MKVLVTGAAGFIGSHVVGALRARGAEPYALVRPGADARHVDAAVVEADYADCAAMARVFQRVAPRALVHSAWRLARGSAYLHDPANVDELRRSLALFTLAHREGCGRVVGIGTCLEYAESDGPADEEAPLRPQTVYAASKAALFTATDAWSRTVGASFAWARLYHPFGPREADHRLIPSVTTALLRGQRVATTAGFQRRNFLFVEDVADAIAAITLAEVEGPFNIGAADTLRVRDLLDRLAGVLGRPDLLDVGALPARSGDPAVLWPDVTRVATAVRWTPRTELSEGLERTVEWWRARIAEAG